MKTQPVAAPSEIPIRVSWASPSAQTAEEEAQRGSHQLQEARTSKSISAARFFCPAILRSESHQLAHLPSNPFGRARSERDAPFPALPSAGCPRGASQAALPPVAVIRSASGGRKTEGAIRSVAQSATKIGLSLLHGKIRKTQMVVHIF